MGILRTPLGALLGIGSDIVNIVVLVPRRPDQGRRDQIWGFTRWWIERHYPLPVFEADSDGRQFSVAQARNRAAAAAGDWDIAIFHDADTIAHPAAIETAIEIAARSDQIVVAGDSHMYCDHASSDRILAGGPLFPRPDSFGKNGIYQRPCSGVFAVNRHLWDTVGGYVESLRGWGFEDLVFLQTCGLFGAGNTWVPDHITLHLWHEPAPRTDDTSHNRVVWQRLAAFRRRRDIAGARAYLTRLGHTLP